MAHTDWKYTHLNLSCMDKPQRLGKRILQVRIVSSLMVDGGNVKYVRCFIFYFFLFWHLQEETTKAFLIFLQLEMQMFGV